MHLNGTILDLIYHGSQGLEDGFSNADSSSQLLQSTLDLALIVDFVSFVTSRIVPPISGVIFYVFYHPENEAFFFRELCYMKDK